MKNKCRLFGFVKIFSVVLIIYGLFGLLLSTTGLFLTHEYTDTVVNDFNSLTKDNDLQKEFELLSITMNDASVTANNAADSIRSAESSLKTANTTTESISKSIRTANTALLSAKDAANSASQGLTNAKTAVNIGSELTSDAAGTFSSIAELMDFEVLGWQPLYPTVSWFNIESEKFEGLSISLSDTAGGLEDTGSYLSNLGHDLESTADSFNTTADRILDLGVNLDTTADKLGSNAEDMDKMSINFKNMSDGLDRVSVQFSQFTTVEPNQNYINTIKNLIYGLLIWFGFIHLLLIGIGFSLFLMTSNKTK